MEPITRKEQILNAILTGDTSNLPEPITREETYLKAIALNGGGGGNVVYEDVSDLPVLTSDDRMIVYVENEACFYFWDGTEWVPQQADISALTNAQVNNLISLL